jgi:hypothetical protein
MMPRIVDVRHAPLEENPHKPAFLSEETKKRVAHAHPQKKFLT